MEIDNKLLFCKKCRLKELNDDGEVVCSITHKSPSFKDSCDDFIFIDAKSFKYSNGVEVVNNGNKRPLFSNFISYVGRITRSEYIISRLLFYVLFSLVVSLVEYYGDKTYIFYMLFPLLIWFRIVSEVKRIHDRGNSWLFIFVPLYSIILIFSDSVIGSNKYGENPKGQNPKNRV